MRRYISFFIALTMVLSLFNFGISANAATEYSAAENFAFSLGVVDKSSYNPDALVTRAEFAEIIARYVGLKDPDAETKVWNDAAFGADDKDESAKGAPVYAFSDIDVSLEQYEAISAVCAMGYMNGVTNTHFLPNYNITMGAAVKVIVCMLGYETIALEKGGWSNGYMTVAASLGIRSGISKGVNDFVTYGECLEMLYNSLDAAVYDFSGIGDKGTVYERGATFLNSVMEIYRAEGVMTDNGITTLYGSSKVGTNSVVVDGVRIYTDDASFHSARYIGREVEAYYRENASGKNELVHMEIMEDDSVSFSPEMFISLKSGKLTYEDERGRVVSETIDENAPLIYNNTVYTEYSPSKFNFPSGTITLLKSGKSSKYDIIVAEDYAVGRVKKVDSTNEVMYIESMYKKLSASKAINLANENGRVVSIKDTDGNKLSAADIKINSIASVVANDDASYVEVIVSTKAVNDFVVDSYQKEDTSITLYSTEESCIIENLQYMTSTPVINVGESYDILLDFNGVPAWIEKAGIKSGAKMAFLIDAAGESNGFNDEYAIRIYSQDGIIETLNLDEKVVLNNKSVSTKDVISEIKGNAEEIILYTTNDDNAVVKSITFALEVGKEDTDDRGWYHISPTLMLSDDESKDAKFWKDFGDPAVTDWESYVNNYGSLKPAHGKYLGKSVHYASSTKVFTVPSDKEEYDNEKKFSVTASNFSGSTKQTFNAYATKPNAMLAEAIAFSSSDLSGGTLDSQRVFLVEKMSNGLNDEEEEVTYISGYVLDASSNIAVARQEKFVYDKEKTKFKYIKQSNTKLYDVPDPDDANSGYDITVHGPAKISELEAGDIIRYLVNADGVLTVIQVAYDSSRGAVYQDDSETHDKGAAAVRGGISAGYPLYVDGNFVKLSGQAPHVMEDTLADLADDKNEYYKYILNPQNIMACDVSPATVFVVENGVRGKIVRKGSLEDIEAYDDTGILDASEYDKVVCTYYWGRTIGTVIYK